MLSFSKCKPSFQLVLIFHLFSLTIILSIFLLPPILQEGSVPATSNSWMPPLPHEPAGFYNDRGATVDIPLDSTKVTDLHCFCYYHDLSFQSTFWSRLTLFLCCAFCPCTYEQQTPFLFCPCNLFHLFIIVQVGEITSGAAGHSTDTVEKALGLSCS